MTTLGTDDVMDDMQLVDISPLIIDAAEIHHIALTHATIGRINRKLAFYRMEVDPVAEQKWREWSKQAFVELESLSNSARAFRQSFKRTSANAYAWDKLLRAYCGNEAALVPTETDLLIDQLAALQDLVPLEQAIQAALSDNSSSLTIFPEGCPSKERERALAETILAIITEEKTRILELVATEKQSQPQSPQPSILDTAIPFRLRAFVGTAGRNSHARYCQLLSSILSIVSIEFSPKNLQNTFPRTSL